MRAAWRCRRQAKARLGLVLWPLSVVLFVVGTLSGGGSKAGLEEPERAQPSVEPTDLSIHPSEPPHHRTISLSHYLTGIQAWARAHWDLLLLLLILAVAAFVRFHQLDLYPNGCQSDECNNGLDALKWLNGVPYRPYAETNEGQATLFTYLIALSFKLFGVGVPQMRLVAALAGLLTVAAFFSSHAICMAARLHWWPLLCWPRPDGTSPSAASSTS